MQHHFTYDELTPLEQCIASYMAGRHWGREDLPTYTEEVLPKQEKVAKLSRTTN